MSFWGQCQYSYYSARTLEPLTGVWAVISPCPPLNWWETPLTVVGNRGVWLYYFISEWCHGSFVFLIKTFQSFSYVGIVKLAELPTTWFFFCKVVNCHMKLVSSLYYFNSGYCMRTVVCYDIHVRKNSVVCTNSVTLCNNVDLLLKTKSHFGKMIIFFLSIMFT